MNEAHSRLTEQIMADQLEGSIRRLCGPPAYDWTDTEETQRRGRRWIALLWAALGIGRKAVARAISFEADTRPFKWDIEATFSLMACAEGDMPVVELHVIRRSNGERMEIARYSGRNAEMRGREMSGPWAVHAQRFLTRMEATACHRQVDDPAKDFAALFD